jgi:hypothetical protein
MRSAMLGLNSKPFAFDIVVLLGYAVFLGVVGTLSFRRMKAV